MTVALSCSNAPLQLFPGERGVFLILPDGSLWRWGQPEGLQSPVAMSPERIGADNDWAEVSELNGRALGLRTNGSLWQWGASYSGGYSNLPRPRNDGQRWKTTVIVNARQRVGIRQDGTLWILSRSGPGVAGRGPEQIGTASNWVSLAALSDTIAGLRADGTLWLWGSARGFWGSRAFAEPTQVCKETNWVSLSRQGVACLSDGTEYSVLWDWPLGAPNADLAASSILTVAAAHSAANRQTLADPAFDIHDDGALWRCDRPFPRNLGPPPIWVRVGTRSDWAQVWCAPPITVALTTNGELWSVGWDPTVFTKLTFSQRLDFLRYHIIGNQAGPSTGNPGAKVRPLLQMELAAPR